MTIQARQHIASVNVMSHLRSVNRLYALCPERAWYRRQHDMSSRGLSQAPRSLDNVDCGGISPEAHCMPTKPGCAALAMSRARES